MKFAQLLKPECLDQRKTWQEGCVLSDHLINHSESESTLQLLWSEERNFPKLQNFPDREYPSFNLVFPKGVCLLETGRVTPEEEAQGCRLSGIKLGLWLPSVSSGRKNNIGLICFDSFVKLKFSAGNNSPRLSCQ